MRETAAAEIAPESIRAFRVQAHHLDRKLPAGAEEAAASVCGFQNSPPGAWETALWNRVEGCTLQAAQSALYAEKRLLQAWSVRGVPLVFPASESGVFLAPLAAAAGETPWIYTRGIAAALDFLGMAFDELLPLVLHAAEYLETHTVARKEALDAALAEIVEAALPAEKLPLWRAPSMYGPRQTVGGAVVSFLLRPCAFYSRVVFGARDGVHPTFTSFQRWTGRAPETPPDAEKRLVQKFLHAHGPADPAALAAWLGCGSGRPSAFGRVRRRKPCRCARQAKRGMCLRPIWTRCAQRCAIRACGACSVRTTHTSTCATARCCSTMCRSSASSGRRCRTPALCSAAGASQACGGRSSRKRRSLWRWCCSSPQTRRRGSRSSRRLRNTRRSAAQRCGRSFFSGPGEPVRFGD